MKSKFFFLVLLCLSTISIAQQIQFPKFEIDSIGYSDLGSMEGSVSIEYINKISAEVKIPSYVVYEGKSYVVRDIDITTSSNDKIKSIIIPEELTYLRGMGNFFALEKIIIPHTVTNISSSVFRYCYNLKEIIIDQKNKLYSAEGSIIYNKDKTVLHAITDIYTEFVVPSSVKEIGYRSCANSYNLRSLIIHDSVIKIGGGAFSDCKNLEFINMGKGVGIIEIYAFEHCDKLESIEMGEGVEIIRGRAFSRCRKLKNVTFNDGLDSICWDAFIYTNLSSLMIPKTVRYIDSSAFCNCDSISTIVVDNNNPYYFADNNILYKGHRSESDEIELILYPSTKIGEFVIPNKVTKVCACGLRDNITSITVHENVKAAYALGRPIELNYNAINLKVYTANYQTLWLANSDRLTNINIGNKVKEIPDYFLFNITALTSITIPNNVKKIGYWAFSFNAFLKSLKSEIIILSHTPPSISEYSFCFSSNDKTTVAFKVPIGSIQTYKATEHWSKFTNYTEFPFYQVNASANDKMRGRIEGVDGCFPDEEIELKAIANSGYEFEKWSDDITDNPRTIKVTKDTSFTAIFKVNQYELKLLSSDTTKGTVEGSGIFDYNSMQEIRATAKHGYEFERWSNGFMLNPMSVKITEDMEITANFKIKQYELNVLSSDTLQGFVEGFGSYDYNTTQTIRAIAKDGYVFDKWNDDNTDNPREIVLLDDTSFTAIFQKEVSLEEVINNRILSLYPNPASKEVIITTDNFNIGSKLKLTDIQGRVLIIESIKGNETKLDVSLLSKGVYFVQLNNIVQKLIIE